MRIATPLMQAQQLNSRPQDPPSPDKPSFAQAQARFIAKHAAWILIAFSITTALLLPYVSRLKLHANFLDLLPPAHPSVKNLKELTSHVGGTSFLIVVFESPDEEAVRRVSEQFSQKAGSFEQVEYVDNRTNIPAFQNRKLLFLTLESLQKLKQNVNDIVGHYRRKTNPLFVDLLDEKPPAVDLKSLELEQKVYRIGGFSAQERDSYMRVVLLKPKHPVSEFMKSELLFEEVARAFKEIKQGVKHPVTLGLTGPYRTRYNEYKTITRDLKRTGMMVMIFLALVNFIAFRNFRSIIYAYLPLVIGTVWIWAFAEATVGYLNLITAFLAAILFGMGGDYTFHILVSFEEDYRLTGNVEKALEMTYSELWKPLWSSMWTTAVVFYAMIISEFEGFRHFGIIAGVGIVISFVIVLYVQPSLIVLGERFFPAKRRPVRQSQVIPKTAIYVVIILGVLFSVYSIFQVPRVKFNYDFTDLRSKGDDAIVLSEKIGSHFGVRLMPVAFITPDREAASKLAVEINHYIETHPETTFDFVAFLGTHVPREQEAKIAVLHEIRGVLDKHDAMIQKMEPGPQNKIVELKQQLKATPLGLEDLPAGIRQQYEGKDQKISIVFVYPRIRILDGQNAKRFVKELRTLKLPPNVKLAGEPVIYADILRLLERDTPIALGISVITVFLLVFRHFKRLDHVLWVHAPFLVGVLWMMGMMAAGNLKFNFFNMVIVPSVLGVGIDNGIYIFDRYRERKNENFFETMRKSLKGVLLSSATNISGFASLMFATHAGVSSMGKLGVFGFVSCLLASVFFVPALIEFFELHAAHLFRRDAKK